MIKRKQQPTKQKILCFPFTLQILITGKLQAHQPGGIKRCSLEIFVMQLNNASLILLEINLK